MRLAWCIAFLLLFRTAPVHAALSEVSVSFVRPDFSHQRIAEESFIVTNKDIQPQHYSISFEGDIEYNNEYARIVPRDFSLDPGEKKRVHAYLKKPTHAGKTAIAILAEPYEAQTGSNNIPIASGIRIPVQLSGEAVLGASAEAAASFQKGRDTIHTTIYLINTFLFMMMVWWWHERRKRTRAHEPINVNFLD